MPIFRHFVPQESDVSGIEQLLMPNTYAKLMARVSPDPQAMLAGSGLLLADIQHGDAPIRVWQQLVCARNSTAMMHRDGWHLAWVSRVAERFHGPITSAWLCAPTLGDGLDVFTRYIPTRLPYLAWRGEAGETRFRCEVRALIDLGDLAPLLLEIPLLTIIEYIRRVYTNQISELVLELPGPALADPAHYRERLRCAPRFDTRHAALDIPREWRTLPNPGYDEHLWAAALRRCEAGLPEESDAALVNAIAQNLQESLEGGEVSSTPPTLREMAGRLHLSVRTLNRRLQAAATTYQDLLDDVRRQRARELLAERRQRVGDIAAALGYRDPASFGRAFKRWFGTTPGRYRRTAGRPGSPPSG